MYIMTDKIITTGLFLLVLQACAKIDHPSGGPKDLNPPKYISASPENRSTNFSESKIDIYFDEYVQLKDQNREILMSPPMKVKPVVRVREKGLRITFNEKLLPDVTYTLNFGNSLSDLNEGNVLPDFEYVFSTGSSVDSLSVTGRVLDAFTQKPEKEGGLLVMLYDNLADSAPLNEIPKYYGRASKEGLFGVNNIHPGTYRVFALKDANNNLKYNPGLEPFAFLDSLLVISPENVKTESFIKDTVKIITPAEKSVRGAKQGSKTAKADTVIAPGKMVHALNISLLSFTEENSRVFITERSREMPEKYAFVFNRPLYDSLKVIPLNFTFGKNWYLKENSASGDTLTYWLTDTLVAKKDTLVMQLSYLTTDSTGSLITRLDTVRLRHQTGLKEGKATVRRTKNEAKKSKKNVLSISSVLGARGTLNLNSDVIFTTDKPIHLINPKLIEFSRLEDTLVVQQDFQCVPDSQSIRKFKLSSLWEEDTQYRLLLKPGSVFDIYGNTNDSLKISFVTQKEDFYGKILLTFSSFNYPMIVQVLNEKENIVKSRSVTKPGLITFDYLSPGKYLLKSIYDKNGNGKWDSGNYLKHIQPEKIYLSGKPQQLRSNWDWETSWSVSEK